MARGELLAEDQVARLAAAAAWRVRLEEAGVSSSVEFESWLAEHPGHVDAWRDVQATWAVLGDMATAPELLAARSEALDRARRTQRRRGVVANLRPTALWGRRAAAAAAALVLMGALGAGGAWVALRPATYATAAGERRVVTLADGSKVALDSNSLIRVRLLRHARRLDLERGQARFDVAHDVTRPFSVHARDQTIVATGTAFNVDLLGKRVVVTLIEGRVSVLPDAAADRPAEIRLEAGQQLAAGAALPAPQVARVSLEQATAWENGQLVFDDEPLASVVERVSRYSKTPVRVASGEVGALRMSGVFNAGDVATFVDTVTRYLPVEARRTDDGAVELRARS
jgi:transmembrane sensor